MDLVEGFGVTGEKFYVVTDKEMHSCVTKAEALSLLIKLGRPGKIVCENNIDPDLPRSWTVLVIHADGRWEPMPSPVETITRDE